MKNSIYLSVLFKCIAAGVLTGESKYNDCISLQMTNGSAVFDAENAVNLSYFIFRSPDRE